MIDVIVLHSKQIKLLRDYFHTKDTPLHDAVVRADCNYTPLNLAHRDDVASLTQPPLPSDKKEKWAQKALHGRHYHTMQSPQIDLGLSYQWLRVGTLFPETEGFLIAIQDQVIATNNYRKYIIKDNSIVTDTCRKCHLAQETIDHVTSGCKILAGTEYTNRHNTAAAIIHQQLATKHNLIDESIPYYRYKPQQILENKEYKLYWDRTIQTHKTVSCNRPDITLIDKNRKQTFLIDIAIPNDRNVIQKEGEKIEKYTPLAIEIKEIWQQKKVEVVPLVISATGVTSTKFTRHLQQLDLPECVHTSIQKAVVLKTCSIVRKFMDQ